MLIVRPEQPADAPAISTVIAAAFENHPHSNQTEHQVVEALRKAEAMPISLVAVDGGSVIGHVAFSTVTIGGEDHGWLGLGPVAVRPDRQRREVGTSLILSGLDDAREAGFRGCVVLGDPNYYRRFGFAPDARLVLEGFPQEHFMALPFGEFNAPTGKVAYHPAFSSCG